MNNEADLVKALKVAIRNVEDLQSKHREAVDAEHQWKNALSVAERDLQVARNNLDAAMRAD